jgi:hypothetical protein
MPHREPKLKLNPKSHLRQMPHPPISPPRPRQSPGGSAIRIQFRADFIGQRADSAAFIRPDRA